MAELIGTFILALSVALSLIYKFPVPTPVVAGLTLGLMVYILGPISGAHLNPAVTLSLSVIKKISPLHTLYYVIAQFLGGFLAWNVAISVSSKALELTILNTPAVGLAEALGAAILLLGVDGNSLI